MGFYNHLGFDHVGVITQFPSAGHAGGADSGMVCLHRLHDHRSHLKLCRAAIGQVEGRKAVSQPAKGTEGRSYALWQSAPVTIRFGMQE